MCVTAFTGRGERTGRPWYYGSQPSVLAMRLHPHTGTINTFVYLFNENQSSKPLIKTCLNINSKDGLPLLTQKLANLPPIACEDHARED